MDIDRVKLIHVSGELPTRVYGPILKTSVGKLANKSKGVNDMALSMKVEEVKAYLQIELEDESKDKVISKMIAPTIDYVKRVCKNDFIYPITDDNGQVTMQEIFPEGLKIAVAQIIQINIKNMSLVQDMMAGASQISFEDFSIRYNTQLTKDTSLVTYPETVRQLIAPYINRDVSFI